MAENLNITAEADRESIFVYDVTGKHSHKNPGGWGDPNLRITDIKSAVLVITPPKMAPVTIDVFPSFPSDKCLGFEVLATDLGLDKIVSGIWPIEYIVTYQDTETTTATLYAKCYFLFDDIVACCIQTNLKKFDTANITSEANKKLLDANNQLQYARWAAENGQMDKAQKVIDYLTNLCNCCL